jgi:hypothetical protein
MSENVAMLSTLPTFDAHLVAPDPKLIQHNPERSDYLGTVLLRRYRRRDLRCVEVDVGVMVEGDQQLAEMLGLDGARDQFVTESLIPPEFLPDTSAKAA